MHDTEEYARMQAGMLYYPNEEQLAEAQQKCLELLYEYNGTRPSEGQKRTELLRRMFAQIGENCYIEPPFYSNWGASHVYFGHNVYANFGLTLVDDGKIYVGDNTMFGPHVTVATAGHPIDPQLRRKGLQYNADVHIGNNVWIGAGSTIVPGVTIGDDVVIGAGSVVTRDIPSGVVAVGTPCRVMREVSLRDREYYFKDKRVDPAAFTRY